MKTLCRYSLIFVLFVYCISSNAQTFRTLIQNESKPLKNVTVKYLDEKPIRKEIDDSILVEPGHSPEILLFKENHKIKRYELDGNKKDTIKLEYVEPFPSTETLPNNAAQFTGIFPPLEIPSNELFIINYSKIVEYKPNGSFSILANKNFAD